MINYRREIIILVLLAVVCLFTFYPTYAGPPERLIQGIPSSCSIALRTGVGTWGYYYYGVICAIEVGIGWLDPYLY